MTEKHRHETVAVAERARPARTQQVAEIQHISSYEGGVTRHLCVVR
jgi:hypothetical protein